MGAKIKYYGNLNSIIHLLLLQLLKQLLVIGSKNRTKSSLTRITL